MRVSTVSKSRAAARGRILSEARRLFFRFGFSKVAMDEVADSLGMSKKTLYEYFPGKEILFREVIRLQMQDVDTRLKAIYRRRDIDPLEKLKLLTTFITGLFASMNSALVHDLRRSAPDLCKQVEEHREKRIRTDFANLIRDGRNKNFFRRDVDERLFLFIYSRVCETILDPGLLSGLPFEPSQVFEATIKVLFEGLLTDKARAHYHEKK